MLQMYLMTIFLLNEKIQDNCYASETPVGERRKKVSMFIIWFIINCLIFTREEFLVPYMQASCKRYLGC